MLRQYVAFCNLKGNNESKIVFKMPPNLRSSLDRRETRRKQLEYDCLAGNLIV